MNLSETTLRALGDLNFTEPTPIQEQAIPQLLAGPTDMLGLAQTGTGKTAAFAIPIIEKIDKSLKKPQAIILCPTRELCLQITSDIEKFTAHTPEIRTVAIYGGASIVNQIRDLRKGVQIIVGTPGRMIDIINRGEIHFEDVQIAVLDEADEMLNMGFEESIREILSKTPEDKNTWLFTATMPKEIRSISKRYMENPIEVQVSVNKGNDNIEHEFYVVSPHNRYAALKRLVDYNPDIFAIVFCRTKNDTKDVADELIRDGYNADALHGDLTQQQRDIVMNRYREKSLQILVATDVAARGIDVSDVTHVIHYALPDDVENYTHRSGRTARAGKKGVSIAIITKREIGKIFDIERIVGKKMLKCTLPNGFDVCEKQLFSIIDKAKSVEVNEERIGPYIEKINHAFENMDKEEIIQRFASVEFNRFLDYYKDAPDLNMREDGKRKTEGSPMAQSGFTRFFINLGSLDDLQRGDLLRLICDSTGIKGNQVGKIDMKGMYSFFEVEDNVQSQIVSNLKGEEFNGRIIKVEIATPNSGGGERGDRGGNDFRRGGGDRGGYKKFGGDRGDRSFGGDRGGRSYGGDRRNDARSNGGNFDTFRGKERKSSSYGGNSYGGNSNNGNSQEQKPKRRENKFPYSFD